MGKEWDSDKGGRDAWIVWLTSVMRECNRVLKPGAHALIWAIPRTSHWTMTALEDAGFEVRDVVTHLFGSGFPKSMDISKAIDKAAGARGHSGSRFNAAGDGDRSNGGDKLRSDHPDYVKPQPTTPEAQQWEGFGTALKPACEFWVLVRKPLGERTVAANVLKHGTGGLNIDGCRIGYASEADKAKNTEGLERFKSTSGNSGAFMASKEIAPNVERTAMGRFPANLVLGEEAAAALDEQSGTLTSGSRSKGRKGLGYHGADGDGGPEIVGSEGGASRFFYVAKASKSDKGAGNIHPTVKSRTLMTYLIRLITPPGGVVLDPFMGSGSTGVAALAAGYGFVGVEQVDAYFKIAVGRIRETLANGKKK